MKSDEAFQYHLTPNGWVQGDEKKDCCADVSRAVPPDRLLSITFHEYSCYNTRDYYTAVDFKSKNKEEITNAIAKFGKFPNDYREGHRDFVYEI